MGNVKKKNRRFNKLLVIRMTQRITTSVYIVKQDPDSMRISYWPRRKFPPIFSVRFALPRNPCPQPNILSLYTHVEFLSSGAATHIETRNRRVCLFVHVGINCVSDTSISFMNRRLLQSRVSQCNYNNIETLNRQTILTRLSVRAYKIN